MVCSRHVNLLNGRSASSCGLFSRPSRAAQLIMTSSMVELSSQRERCFPDELSLSLPWLRWCAISSAITGLKKK